MKRYAFVLPLVLLVAVCPVRAEDMPGYKDTSLPPEVRAADLVSRMTLKEKVSQFGNTTPAIPRLGVTKYEYWSEALHGVARSGQATSFPQANALAATWNPELMQRVASAISDEARVFANRWGKGLTYWSPTINMARDPRWGRSEESYGEDPYLTSRLAVAFVKGMQGDDPRYLKTIATVKHFAANNSEFNRHNGSSDVDETTLREYYFPAFRAAVEEAGAFSVMSAYNAVNGVPCSANTWLLTDVLRKEWGFKGYVVSDCDAISDIFTGHRYVDERWMAAAVALKAGTDLNCGKTSQQCLARALTEGSITEREIDTALVRILTARFRLGEFDPAGMVPYRRMPNPELLSPEHDALARQSARESMVLLKNKGAILPLDPKGLKSIAVIGPNADRVQLGGYSGTPPYSVTPLQGIRNAVEGRGVAVSYEQGCAISSSAATGGYLYNLNWVELSGGKAKRRVEAEDFSEQQGITVEDKGEGTRSLGYINHGEYAVYPGIDFKGLDRISARVAAEGDHNGGVLEVRLDNPEGMLVATLKVPRTGAWDRYTTVSGSLPKLNGRHDMVLRFLAKGYGDAADGIRKAAEAAAKADVAVVVLGTDLTVADEEKDRPDLSLPYPQEELVKAVYRANPRTVAVLVTGFPLAVNWLDANVPGILCAWYGGQAQGDAMAEVLFGQYNPGGRLTTTWYRSEADLPPIGDYRLHGVGKGRTYMHFTGSPLYPFGYGLGYSAFGYGKAECRVDGGVLGPGGKAVFSVPITNQGAMEGDEVVQLYVTGPGNPGGKPIKALKAFRRVGVKPGSTVPVELELPYKALECWDDKAKAWVVDPGEYTVSIGPDSATARVRTTLRVGGYR